MDMDMARARPSNGRATCIAMNSHGEFVVSPVLMHMSVARLSVKPLSPSAFSKQKVHPESTTTVDISTSCLVSRVSIAELRIASVLAPPSSALSEKNTVEWPVDVVIGLTLRLKELVPCFVEVVMRDCLC